MLADCICYVHNRGMEQEHPGMLNIKDYHHFFSYMWNKLGCSSMEISLWCKMDNIQQSPG